MSIKPNNHTIGRLTQTFTYDKAGNNQHHNATYNTSNNQLLEDDTFTYTYDKKGNLARKIDKETQELYIYKYNALYHNQNIIAILDNTKEEPTLLASIVHHPSRTDTPLSITNHETNCQVQTKNVPQRRTNMYHLATKKVAPLLK